MANANAPRGLVPYGTFAGGYWTGAANMYYVGSGDSNNIFVGDPVALASGSTSVDGTPVATIATAAGTNKLLGAMVGIVSGGSPIIAVTRDLPIYRQASVATYILVSDDPGLLYWIQDDGSAQGTYAPITWAGKNASLVAGSGSTVTGYSGWELAASTVAAGSNLQLKIMRFLNQPDNAFGTTINTNMNAKWLVKINIHQYADSTNGV